MTCGFVTIWWQSCRLTKGILAPCWITQEKWGWDSIRGRRDSNLSQINRQWSLQVPTCIQSQPPTCHYLMSLWKFLVPQIKFSSVQLLSRVQLITTHEPKYARHTCPSPVPGIHPKGKEESEKVGIKLNIQKTKIMSSDPITSWQIDGETVETVADFIFGVSKITADGGCSHEIKRCLLLGRKVMTSLDSILKTRDITLPTNVRLVKAMVFPVVMCGCESWTIKKAEHWIIHVFELWCWRKLLRVLGLQGDPICPS